jgi:hypothetical protein
VLVFPVSEKKARALRDKMQAARCLEQDLVETFFRRAGVDLRHKPTGIRIRCVQASSQALNRYFARRLLVEELEAQRIGKNRHELKAEKIREEKKKPSRQEKRQTLAAYHLRPINPHCPNGVPTGLAPLLAQLRLSSDL